MSECLKVFKPPFAVGNADCALPNTKEVGDNVMQLGRTLWICKSCFLYQATVARNIDSLLFKDDKTRNERLVFAQRLHRIN